MQTYLKPKPKTTDKSMTTLIQPPTKTPAATNPEIELILCCARTNITTATAERIKTLVQQNINWNYLIETASRHGVLPLLYQSLKTTCPDTLAHNILAQLKNFFHSNALRNLFLTQELLKLLTLLKENDIQAIPFKGPVLAISAYGNLSLRQFSDLDILVSKQDYEPAKELLRSVGYSTLYDKEHETSYLQAQMWHQERQINVDLHYGIPPQELHLDIEGFWQRLEPVSFMGTTILTLSPEDHLLILCINGHKQEWLQLSDICSIALMISTYPNIDWQRLIEQAQNLRIRRILYLILLLVKNLFNTPVPEEILSTINNDTVITWLASKWCDNCLFNNDTISQDTSSNPNYLMSIGVYKLIISEYKHKNLLHWLVPNREDRAFVPVPNSMSWFYYFLRPIRLINKYGFNPLKYMFQRLRLGE